MDYSPSADDSSRPLRVWYLSHEGGMYGAQQSLLLLLKHLPTYVQAHVSLARRGPLEEELSLVKSVTTHSHKRLQWIKHSKRNPIQWLGDMLGLLISGFWRVPALAMALKQHQIDVVHTNSLVSLEGPLAAALAGIPHVWHIREMFTIQNPRFVPLVPQWAVRWVAHTIGGHLVCISKAVEQQFVGIPPSHKHIVYNPVLNPTALPSSSAHYPSNANSPPYNVGFVGRLSPGKGLLPLLSAIAQLNESSFPVTLHCYGQFVDDAAEAEIRKHIDDLDIASQVVLHGFTTDKAALFSQMDVMALPSTNEAFGRVLIEAMAHGVPCVGTNAAAIPEVLEPIVGKDYLFDANNPASMAQTICHALTDKCRPSAHSLYNYSQTFSPNAHAQAVLNVYKAAILP